MRYNLFLTVRVTHYFKSKINALELFFLMDSYD